MRSSVKPSHAANDDLEDELIERTRQVWQPRLGRDLTREDDMLSGRAPRTEEAGAR